MSTRPALLVTPDIKDPSVLGYGTSKLVWRWEDFAIVNGTDKQRDITLPSNTKHIDEKNIPIQMEYNFTVYLHQLFMSDTDCPFVIPKVYLFQKPDIFKRRRVFRYAKELCEKVVINDELVNTMIKITDYLSDHGWVYLDMKPANLGLLNGKICILDTDYSNFYRVPEDLKEDFRNWSHLIIVMFSYLFLRNEVNKQTLVQIIRSRNLNETMLKDLWSKQVDDSAAYGKQLDKANSLANKLMDFGNEKFSNVKEYIQLEKGDIVCPYLFYLQYGQPEKKDPAEKKGPKPQIKIKLPLGHFRFMMSDVLSKEMVEPEVAAPQNDFMTRLRNEPVPDAEVPKKQAPKKPVPKAREAPMTGTLARRKATQLGPGTVTRKAKRPPNKAKPSPSQVKPQAKPSGPNVPPAGQGTFRPVVKGDKGKGKR